MEYFFIYRLIKQTEVIRYADRPNRTKFLGPKFGFQISTEPHQTFTLRHVSFSTNFCLVRVQIHKFWTITNCGTLIIDLVIKWTKMLQSPSLELPWTSNNSNSTLPVPSRNQPINSLLSVESKCIQNMPFTILNGKLRHQKSIKSSE